LLIEHHNRGIKIIDIRKARIRDRKMTYNWLYYSDFSDYLNDLGGISKEAIPSYEYYKKEEYMDFYFDDSQPDKGRAYIIVCKKNGKIEDIGIISYTSFHLLDKITEFDIWLKKLSLTGQGYGTKALLRLVETVRDLGYEKVIIRPSKHNKRAIKSYQKAGFIQEELEPKNYYLSEYLPKYSDGDYESGGDVFMVLKL
jgi:RimJ/RimL family protein N-acetyltransferase